MQHATIADEAAAFTWAGMSWSALVSGRAHQGPDCHVCNQKREAFHLCVLLFSGVSSEISSIGVPNYSRNSTSAELQVTDIAQ